MSSKQPEQSIGKRASQKSSLWKVDIASSWPTAGCGCIVGPGLGDAGMTFLWLSQLVTFVSSSMEGNPISSIHLSICPSIHFFDSLSNRLTFDLNLLLVCVWVITIACLGLDIKSWVTDGAKTWSVARCDLSWGHFLFDVFRWQHFAVQFSYVYRCCPHCLCIIVVGANDYIYNYILCIFSVVK